MSALHKTLTIEPLFIGRTDAARALAISLRSLSYLIPAGHFAIRKLGCRILIATAEFARSAESEQAPLCL